MTLSHLQRIQWPLIHGVLRLVPVIGLLLWTGGCAAPQQPAPEPDPLWRLRRTGLPLRPVARVRQPPGPAPKPQAADQPPADKAGPAGLQALTVLGSRLGKPPAAVHSCAAAAAGAPGGASDNRGASPFAICLGAALPPPLQEALVAERRDSASGKVVAITAELAFPAGTGAAQARFAELGALLRRAYGAPRQVGPQLQQFTTGRYAVALELVKDQGGQAYVYLDLGPPQQRR